MSERMNEQMDKWSMFSKYTLQFMHKPVPYY